VRAGCRLRMRLQGNLKDERWQSFFAATPVLTVMVLTPGADVVVRGKLASEVICNLAFADSSEV